MHLNIECFKLKRPSKNSKGIACLRFGGNGGEPYPRELIVALKEQWHFFWFSSWKYSLTEIPYHDLIDIFVVWDDLAEEIRQSRRTDCVIVRGGCETFEQHDRIFFPAPAPQHDIDLLYIARFIAAKRCDMALKCVHYLAERMPNVRAVFLESGDSEPETSAWIKEEVVRLGLQTRIMITTVPIGVVNVLLNRARLTLFTSDLEGLCRAVLQSLLAERPILCYRNTKALTRVLFDDRYFHYYDEQTDASIGAAALEILSQTAKGNACARRYVLHEKQMKFLDLREWQSQILHASLPLYSRDGQYMKWEDCVSGRDLNLSEAWKTFSLVPDYPAQE